MTNDVAIQSPSDPTKGQKDADNATEVPPHAVDEAFERKDISTDDIPSVDEKMIETISPTQGRLEDRLDKTNTVKEPEEEKMIEHSKTNLSTSEDKIDASTNCANTDKMSSVSLENTHEDEKTAKETASNAHECEIARDKGPKSTPKLDESELQGEMNDVPNTGGLSFSPRNEKEVIWPTSGSSPTNYSMHALASNAILSKQLSLPGLFSSRALDCVREMHAYNLSPFPSPMRTPLTLKFPLHRMAGAAALVADGLYWGKDNQHLQLLISSNDLLGATLRPKQNEFAVHYMLPGRGIHERALYRRYKTKRFKASTAIAATEWVKAIQNAVKWLARVPLDTARRCKVIINPHSGRRKAPWTWNKWKPFFALADIACDVEETTHANHAFEIAQTFPTDGNYECIVIVGGDGTANEFLNGLMSRPESEWRTLVSTTPFAFLATGTDNALSLGIGVPTHMAAIFAIVKRKLRSLDALAIQVTPNGPTTYAYCGASLGLPADVAKDSESHRWMGTWRYAYLKVKHALGGQRYVYRLHYVESSTAPSPLKTFYELQDAAHQHTVEQRSLYGSSSHKEWLGSLERPSEVHHTTDDGTFLFVGGVNLYFDAKYSHPSDGQIDLVGIRRGASWIQTGRALWRANRGQPDPLLLYRKVEAVDIWPQGEHGKVYVNVDGEAVEATPGVVRIHVVPRLLCVLSEK
ncbi:hypothetical protein Ae201684P_008550 [Aphanomyces euteiches]|uniref:DAGKc domain-containing protein n=1 Tax=Aphanomyces euteiches TaxID=100861 RepID=A0A6G0XNN4_9STRA|nr:hypothetical protein Ae201684_002776 [Aphanomyces euteiches]KAH9092884.1 hypothetical protein Ae201684P_008550 [Aphanomyces euteiches]